MSKTINHPTSEADSDCEADSRDLREYLARLVREVDGALDRFLPSAEATPPTIHEAMRHCIFAGGKRLRPVLCLAAAEACGGSEADALPAACAVELMHTYSLVHDDLPCMDDDDLRRGKPTCHVLYGENIAVLCGDALLTCAFEALADARATPLHSVSEMIRELAMAGGSRRLIGGQVMDVEGEGCQLGVEGLVRIHEAKTGALLTSSLVLGAMSANASAEAMQALRGFGHSLGLAFQVIDDILDVTQTTDELGKTAGKDQAVAKSTYPSVLGLEGAREEARRLTASALAALEPLGDRAARLREISSYLLERQF